MLHHLENSEIFFFIINNYKDLNQYKISLATFFISVFLIHNTHFDNNCDFIIFVYFTSYCTDAHNSYFKLLTIMLI